MTLAAGRRLGPYEVLGPLGSGGMGEVYRALDPRLGREVAVKVLPAEFSEDASRLKRFEKEARSASALNHPNIVTIYDIGAQEGVSYIAMEKVQGSSLRELVVSGPMALRKLFPIATQIAEGLSKAHEAGIVHRDLKPENVMVTKDGLVKILDFGLAKLTGPLSGSGEGSLMPTMTGTSPGVVVGTAAYMSPEQASGEAVGFASDQFSFGSILYEMATGKRAFQRKTGIDTLAAILNDDPEPIAAVNPQTPAPLRWIVERCHAKDPEARYAATRDLAREIATLRDHLSEAVSGAIAPTKRSRRGRWLLPAGALMAAALAAAAYLYGTRKSEPPLPFFQQLTFRRGEIYSARFAPDGETFVYTAAWDGKPMEIYVGRIQSADARPFGLADTELLSISKSGEMAVSLQRTKTGPRSGTLAQVSIGGGVAPREILEEVKWADWAPDGRSLAVVRDQKVLEYPAGKTVYEVKTQGFVSHPRISPDGALVAFILHADDGKDEGEVFIVDRSGKATKLAGPYYSAWGLAWSPGGEIWFSASPAGNLARSLYSVSPEGKPRIRARVAGSLELLDISRQGRILFSRSTHRMEMMAIGGDDTRARDLTWLDWSSPVGISRDGAIVYFTGPGGDFAHSGLPGATPDYFVYLRRTDGSPPVRLGPGQAVALSPDGRLALAISQDEAGTPDPTVTVYQTGAGEARRLAPTGQTWWGVNANCFLPDNRRFLVTAAEAGRESPRVFVRSIDGARPVPLTPENYGGGIVAPDGSWALVNTPPYPSPETRHFRCSIPGGELQEIRGLGPDALPVQISNDGHSLFLVGANEVPRKVYRLDLATGRRELWRAVAPSDVAGVGGLLIRPSGGDSYVWQQNRTLSDLFLLKQEQ